MGLFKKRLSKAQRTLEACTPPPEIGSKCRSYSNHHKITTVEERQDFIRNALIVLSDNGKRKISNCEVRIVYIRSLNQTSYIASLIAVKNDQVVHSITPQEKCRGSQFDIAFRGLVRHVEDLLGVVLANVEWGELLAPLPVPASTSTPLLMPPPKKDEEVFVDAQEDVSESLDEKVNEGGDEKLPGYNETLGFQERTGSLEALLRSR